MTPAPGSGDGAATESTAPARDTRCWSAVLGEMDALMRGALSGLRRAIERAGGWPEQQQRWLPRIASGELLTAVAVTEPDCGSDVAAIRLRATPAPGGWRLDGAKSWCTFAGMAELLLVLARTDPAATPPHRGLTLFLVEKPGTAEKSFRVAIAGGGTLSGQAIPTIGHRGMRSFTLYFDDVFVPAEQMVGGDAGEGRGFYPTMHAFAGGRLQTAARACELMRAAFESAVGRTRERRVFGKPLAQQPLARAKLVNMAATLRACREFTYAVARAMDRGDAHMRASLAKLYTCRAAEGPTREAMQLYGRTGYAEQSAVSRYFPDARVLSIFEGAEEALALKVIARQLVLGGRAGD